MEINTLPRHTPACGEPRGQDPVEALAPGPQSHLAYPNLRRGALLLAVAAVCFALTTVFAKLANLNGVPALQAGFARFFVSFLVMGVVAWRMGLALRPNRPRLIMARAVGNTLAVALFFLAIEFSPITHANLLNMTSPIWIFLLAPLFTPGMRPTLGHWSALVLTLAGVYWVVMPAQGTLHFGMGEAYGALSGLAGGIAISFLALARRSDKTELILFYQMGFGTLALGLLGGWQFVLPAPIDWLWLLLSAAFGLVGQWLLTAGYKYIDAPRGSLVSASQSVFGAAFGIVLFAEVLSWHLLVGAAFLALAMAQAIGLTQKWVLSWKKNLLRV